MEDRVDMKEWGQSSPQPPNWNPPGWCIPCGMFKDECGKHEEGK